MKQEDLFKKIGLILNELNNQYEFLAQNPQLLNELELELFHANANFLSDHVQIIKKIAQQAPTLEIPAPEEQNKEVPTIQIEDRTEEFEQAYHGDSMQEEQQIETIAFAEETELESDFVEEEKNVSEPVITAIETEVFKLDNSPSTFEFILNDHAEHEPILEEDNEKFKLDNYLQDADAINVDDKFDFEEKSVDELFNRPLSQEEENILAQKRKLNPVENDELINADEDEIGPEPFLVSTAPADDFPIEEEDLALEVAAEPTINVTHDAVVDPNYKPTLNDLLAGKKEQSVNHQTAHHAITDLRQAINLNDKLLYIKDLFNGYNLAYAEAIDLANKLPNFEAADNFFKKNYAVKNNWADKQATVDKFYSLLNQRFK